MRPPGAPRFSRRVRVAGLAAVLLAFVAVSAGLAQVLSANSSERSAVVGIVRAEAAGDVAGVVGRLAGCASRPGCRAVVGALVARLRRPGRVQIVRFDPSTRFSPVPTTGDARVAWLVPARAGVVIQCLRVRRRGDPIRGLRVALLALSAPVLGPRRCPAGF